MKCLDFVDAKKFGRFHAISCIESYLLYIMSENNYDYKHLYAHSYNGFANILEDFVITNNKFEYYTGIPRLQKTALMYNLISIDYIETKYEDINLELNSSYYLMKTNPSFVEKNWGVIPWRSDHYVLIASIDNPKWSFVNNYPPKLIKLPLEEIENVFGGTIVELKLIEIFTENIKEMLFKDFYVSINKEITPLVIKQFDILAIRDALAILKIIRQRTFEYCSLYVCCEFMLPYINRLERAFSHIEYTRLRNNVDYKEIVRILEQLYFEDINVFSRINKMMGEKI